MRTRNCWIRTDDHRSRSRGVSRLAVVVASAVSAAGFGGVAGVGGAAHASSGPTFESATTSSLLGISYLSAPKPPTTSPGDVLLALVTVNQSTGAVINPPAGWRLECWQANWGGPALVQSAFTYVAGNSEPSSYQWSFPANSGAVIGIAAYNGVDATTRVEGCAGSTAAGTNSIGAPAITTTAPNATVISAFAFRGSGTTTPPTGTTERFDARTAPDGARSVSASYADRPAPTAGTVGAVTANISLTATNVVSMRFALRAATGGPLFSDSFTRPDGLVTNEFAHWNPNDPNRVSSPDWDVTSGSLFIYHGRAWTGRPDNVGPNATSSNGTNSAVFRLITKLSNFTNVRVKFSLWNWGLTSTPSTPAKDWDGAHVFLRYQNEAHLYYVSINRRDNTVIIKKKVPGGPSNGGSYPELSPAVAHTVPYGQAQQMEVTVQTNPAGSVTIRLYAQGALLVEATDNGSIGGPVISAPGATGIRGDNANLELDDFEVTALG